MQPILGYSNNKIMKPILICSNCYYYGLYLQSLIEQVFEDSTILVRQPFKKSLLRKYKPGMLVIEIDKSFVSQNQGILKKKIPVILIQDNSSPSESPSSLKVFNKPLKIREFLETLYSLYYQKTDNQTEFNRSVISDGFTFIGHSSVIKDLRKNIYRISKTDLNVLIYGQTGTGKGLVALLLHHNSRRRNNQFLQLNCANVPCSLLESELFGHKKGAFTDACSDKPGKFQLASKGTIFLDEVSEMSSLMQAKLLHVLQDGEFSPVGSLKNIKSDVRIIAATNADLNSMKQLGNFRTDLYYRLAVLGIYIPPLKEHKTDIYPLTIYFLDYYSKKYNKKVPQPSKGLWQRFSEYDWPGNVRELENAVKLLVVMENEELIKEKMQEKKLNIDNYLTSLNEHINYGGQGMSLKELSSKTASNAEKKLIRKIIYEHKVNKKMASHMLQISYKSLLNKIKKYGL